MVRFLRLLLQTRAKAEGWELRGCAIVRYSSRLQFRSFFNAQKIQESFSILKRLKAYIVVYVTTTIFCCLNIIKKYYYFFIYQILFCQIIVQRGKLGENPGKNHFPLLALITFHKVTNTNIHLFKRMWLVRARVSMKCKAQNSVVPVRIQSIDMISNQTVEKSSPSLHISNMGS